MNDNISFFAAQSQPFPWGPEYEPRVYTKSTQEIWFQPISLLPLALLFVLHIVAPAL